MIDTDIYTKKRVNMKKKQLPGIFKEIKYRHRNLYTNNIKSSTNETLSKIQ